MPIKNVEPGNQGLALDVKTLYKNRESMNCRPLVILLERYVHTWLMHTKFSFEISVIRAISLHHICRQAIVITVQIRKKHVIQIFLPESFSKSHGRLLLQNNFREDSNIKYRFGNKFFNLKFFNVNQNNF